MDLRNGRINLTERDAAGLTRTLEAIPLDDGQRGVDDFKPEYKRIHATDGPELVRVLGQAATNPSLPEEVRSQSVEQLVEIAQTGLRHSQLHDPIHPAAG